MTPLMKQYWEIKASHPDKILLFRMGDFYEMFHQDAVTAAPILNIALTSRNKKTQDETPMCGFPHHAVSGPINRLLQAGLKVAICDQIEDPKLAKGLVKRAVTRILSPGVVFDFDTLDEAKPNYVVAFDERALAAIDSSTGECFYFEIGDPSDVPSLLQTLKPVEVLITEEQKKLLSRETLQLLHLTTWDAEKEKSLAAFVCPDGWQAAPKSCLQVLVYICSMQGPDLLATLGPLEKRALQGRVVLSGSTVKHLELFETYQGEAKGSLFFAIDRTKSSMGRRRLKSLLSFPLLSEKEIEKRLTQVEKWVATPPKLQMVRDQLQGIGDLERRLAKLSHPNCNGRDLWAIAESLGIALSVYEKVQDAWRVEHNSLQRITHAVRKVEDTLVEAPPLSARDGGMVRAQFSPELDELVDLAQNSQKKLADFEAREKERTGINSLKVRYNQVFGFYIEITNTHKDKAPSDYQRKQTLANAERFTTDELTELERLILSAKSKRNDLEFQIFQNLRQELLAVTGDFLKLAYVIADCDVILALAWLALENKYCRPQFSSQNELHLKNSRHPVVEQQVQKAFVPNSLSLKKGECLLLTGPNMAGKSTLMRQVALISLMAQIGSFVPAEQAILPLYDQILTRIGASDFISEGLSTFMVEMKETAEILKSATDSSLIVLDEIGRGTATFDGMSLAQAILEYLLDKKRGQILFATHYHEITSLVQKYINLHNGHMAIRERNGEISFLYTLTAGPAEKSYGIHVARLAGLPASVTKRAEQILKKQEGTKPSIHQLSLLGDESELREEVAQPVAPQFDPVQEKLHEFARALKEVDVNSLRPMEALQLLDSWSEQLKT